jgi:site-specific DNA-methyltransferase (adenine-specific)
MNNIIFKHQEGLQFLEDLPSNSVDLILTDPPYITSRDSGMDKWVGHVEKQDQEGAKPAKSKEQWDSYKTEEEWQEWFDESKIKPENQAAEMKKMEENFLKYGSIYGKKYAVKTNYGDWDSDFTMETLDQFTKHFYRVLRDGGTAIIFFDLWKITALKEMLETCGPSYRGRQGGEVVEKTRGFKQIRFIEWIKTNPQPINSQRNYLTNCREIALTGVKKSKGYFDSHYDNGIYRHPLQGGKERFHPTQKSLPLFEELVIKHSEPGDIIVDPFAGSATTAIACMNTGRRFMGCEMSEEYFTKAEGRIQRNQERLNKEQSSSV